MIKFESEIKIILSKLHKSGLLSNCIISGSWAMYFYNKIFEGFVPPIATTDFDIFLPNISKIKPSNISELFLDINYLRHDDYLSGKTHYLSKNGFEIEFLTLPNRTMNGVIKVKALNIGAEALPKLLPIVWNYITVNFEGYDVNIPSPSSYCLQKILINEDRSIDKQIKDIDAIKYVLTYVNASKKYRQEFIDLFNASPKRWQKLIKQTIEKRKLITPIE